MAETDRRDKFGWHPLDLKKRSKASAIERLSRRVGLTHVVVPPYLRVENGKVIQVAGYEYDRAGPGPMSSLRTATAPAPAPTSAIAKTDIQDQRKHGKQPIHLDADKYEAIVQAVGIDMSKIKSIKLRFRDMSGNQGVTQNLGGGNFRVVVGIKPKDKYEDRHLYVVNNSLVHELRHVTQMQKGNQTEYLASKEDFAAANLQHAKAGGYVKMEAESQMFGRLAWHGDPAQKPLGPLAKDKEHMGKALWAIAFDPEQSARGDVGHATWEGDEPLNANFRTFTSPAKDRRNYVARITGGDMTTEKGLQREFLEDAWEKTGEQELSGGPGSLGMEWNGMEWNGMEWNGMEWQGKLVLEKWQPRIPAQDGVYEVQFYHQDPNKQKSKDTKTRHHVIVKGGIARVEIDPDELQAAMSADMPAKVFLAGTSAIDHLVKLARVNVDPYLRKGGGKVVSVAGHLRAQSIADTNEALRGAIGRTKERAKTKTPEFDRADGGAPPVEKKAFAEHLKANDYKMFHAGNVEAILKNGLLSDKDQGNEEMSEDELEDLDEPYLYDGVFVGNQERAEDFGSADNMVEIDLKGLDDKLFEWSDLEDGRVQALLVGSIPPDRIKKVEKRDIHSVPEDYDAPIDMDKQNFGRSAADILGEVLDSWKLSPTEQGKAYKQGRAISYEPGESEAHYKARLVQALAKYQKAPKRKRPPK